MYTNLQMLGHQFERSTNTTQLQIYLSTSSAAILIFVVVVYTMHMWAIAN